MTQRNALVMNAGLVEQLQSSDSFLNGLAPGHRNTIINGGMDIWQRGTSFSSPTSGTFLSDRWVWFVSSSGNPNFTQSTNVPASGVFKQYSLLATVATTQSVSAGTSALITQRIEGLNFQQIAQRSFTISFWVQCSLTGIFCVSLANSGNDRCYIAEYTIAAANTWQKVTINVPATPSAGTWNYLTGLGLQINFALAVGSNFQGTKNAWNTTSGIQLGTSNQVNFFGTNGATFYVTQVQIEQGDCASPFESQNINELLCDCYRYYQVGGYSSPIVTGGVTSVVGHMDLPVALRNGPPSATLTTTAPQVNLPGTGLKTATGSVLSFAMSTSLAALGYGLTGFTFAGGGIPGFLNGDYIILNAEI